MVIPPVVYCAGLLRARGQTVQTNAWSWIGTETGQRLFEPPNVAGWDYTHWLDTSRWSARFQAITITAVPEPTAFALLGLGILSLVIRRRR